MNRQEGYAYHSQSSDGGGSLVNKSFCCGPLKSADRRAVGNAFNDDETVVRCSLWLLLCCFHILIEPSPPS